MTDLLINLRIQVQELKLQVQELKVQDLKVRRSINLY
jgi:hypothetical protein